MPAAQAPDGTPAPGETFLGGKYRIEKLLGIGGMGSVYSATHLTLGNTVAVKFIHHAMRSDEVVGRFLREGQSAVKIQSEHVARVLDVGVLDNGVPYLMMEFLVGADLAQYIQESGALPLQEAVDFLIQTCDALAQAHLAGIVHRDLKPSNLFVTPRPDGSLLLKVLDFGISKSADGKEGGGLGLTKEGEILGSPLYMSPEQLRDATQVDARSDIWALGVVFFELLAGRTMFEAESFLALCTAIATEVPRSIKTLVPDVPDEIDRTIARCVETDVALRFQTVNEFAAAIAPFASPEGAHLAARINRLFNPSDPPPRKTPSMDPARPNPTPSGVPSSKRSVRAGDQTPISTTEAFAQTAGSGTLPMSISQARTDTKSKNPLYIAGAVALVLVGASGTWMMRSQGQASSPPAPPSVSAAGSGPAAATSTSSAASATPVAGSAAATTATATASEASAAPTTSAGPKPGTLKPLATAAPKASAPSGNPPSEQDLLKQRR